MSNKNKKIIQGEEDEEEDDYYDDDEYDTPQPPPQPVKIIQSTSNSNISNNMNLNKEISINDQPEDKINSDTAIFKSNGGSSDSLNKNISSPINNNIDTQPQQLSPSSSTTTITNNIISPSDTISPITNTVSSLSPENTIVSNDQQQKPQPIYVQSQQPQQVLPTRKLSTPQLPQQPLQTQPPQQPQQPMRIPLSLGENKLREFNENLRKSYCTKTHGLYYSIHKEVSGANQHLNSVIDIVKSIQHNIRQYNDDILTLEERLEQTEWSLQC